MQRGAPSRCSPGALTLAEAAGGKLFKALTRSLCRHFWGDSHIGVLNEKSVLSSMSSRLLMCKTFVVVNDRAASVIHNSI